MTEPTDTPPTVVSRPPVFAKFYHASGLQVSVPLAVGLDPVEVYRDMDNWLAAGWKPEPPGLEPGEQKEEIGWVVRKIQENDRGDAIRLDLYVDNEGMKFPNLTVYLDDEGDIAAFEKATGLKIQDVPLYSGTDKIERGKSRAQDKFVLRLPRPVRVVWKQNPKYNAEEAKTTRAAGKVYKTPQRLFVRWDSQTPSPPASSPQAQSQGPQAGWPAVVDQDVIDDWQRFLVTRPTAAQMNDKLKEAAGASNETKKAIFAIASRYAEEQGYDWLHDAKCWVDPNPPAVDGDEIPF